MKKRIDLAPEVTMKRPIINEREDRLDYED